MRDPELNLNGRLDVLQKQLQQTTNETIKRQLRDEIRMLERRTQTIQRMKAYGVKFRKNV